MQIREARRDDAAEWGRLRALLWPGEDHAGEIARWFAGETLVSCPGGGAAAVLVCDRGDGRLGGFVEVGTRPFAEGCESRPVGYIEGWFVDEDVRRRGVGGALIRAAEAWARAHGCVEMASDCAVGNEVSLHAHLALGYREHERVIQLCKKL